MYEFTDKFGDHSHTVSEPGRAYNPTAPILCPACLDKIATYRLELCNKYGWKVWPDVISVV